jgi:predicted DNA-binding protein
MVMPEKKLSVRLPPELAEALERQENASGVGQSRIVRDALTKFLIDAPDCVSAELKQKARFIQVLLQEKECEIGFLKKEVDELCHMVSDSESYDS